MMGKGFSKEDIAYIESHGGTVGVVSSQEAARRDSGSDSSSSASQRAAQRRKTVTSAEIGEVLTASEKAAQKRQTVTSAEIGEVSPAEAARLKASFEARQRRKTVTAAEIGEVPPPKPKPAPARPSEVEAAKADKAARDKATAEKAVEARAAAHARIRAAEKKAADKAAADKAARDKAARDKAIADKAARDRIRAAEKKAADKAAADKAAADKAARDKAIADKAARDRIRAAEKKAADKAAADKAARDKTARDRAAALARIRAAAPIVSAAKLKDIRRPKDKPLPIDAGPSLKPKPGDLPPASRAEALRIAKLRATTLKKGIDEPGDPVVNTMLLMTPIIGTYKQVKYALEDGKISFGEGAWIAVSAITDLLLVARVAGTMSAAARATSGLSRTNRVVTAARAGGRQVVSEFTAPITAVMHPVATVKGLIHSVETVVRPSKVPLSAVETSFSTVRIPVSATEDAAQAMKLRDNVTRAVIEGTGTTARVGDTTVDLSRTALQKLGRPVAVHSTPDVRQFLDGVTVTPGREGGLFVAPNLHSRFTGSSAFGDMPEGAINGALLIRDKKILQQLTSSKKIFAGTAEIEGVLPGGVKLPPPVQTIITRDAGGNKLTLLVFGEKLSPGDIVNLKITGSIDTVRQIFTPSIRVTKGGRVVTKNIDEIAQLNKEAGKIQDTITELRAAGKTAAAVTEKARLTRLRGRIDNIRVRVNANKAALSGGLAVVRTTGVKDDNIFADAMRQGGKPVSKRTYRQTPDGRVITTGKPPRVPTRAELRREIDNIKRRPPAEGRRDEPPPGKRRPPAEGRRDEPPPGKRRPPAEGRRDEPPPPRRDEPPPRRDEPPPRRDDPPPRIADPPPRRDDPPPRIDDPPPRRDDPPPRIDDPPPPPPPPPPSLPRSATDKQNRQKIKKAGGAVGWQQGRLRGEPVYHVLMHPYLSKSDFVTVVGGIPEGATIASGKGTAFRTIQRLQGKSPARRVTLDMGIQDVAINPVGKGVTIAFKRDPRQLTTSDITIGHTVRSSTKPKSRVPTTGLKSFKRGKIYHTPIKSGTLLSRRPLGRRRSHG